MSADNEAYGNTVRRLIVLRQLMAEYEDNPRNDTSERKAVGGFRFSLDQILAQALIDTE